MQTPTIHAAILRLFDDRQIILPNAAEAPAPAYHEQTASHDFLIVCAHPDLSPNTTNAEDFVSLDGTC